MEAVKRIRVLRVTGLTGDKERAVRRTHAARRVIDRCAEPQGLALGPMPFWGDIGTTPVAPIAARRAGSKGLSSSNRSAISVTSAQDRAWTGSSEPPS
jgi:hypothetical protein